MRIGFDLDGIFIDKPPFIPKAVIEWFFRSHTSTLSYRIPNIYEQHGRKLIHFPFMRPPLLENMSILRKLHKEGHQLYLISSRFGFLEKITYKWLTKHGIRAYFTDIYLNTHDKQPHLFKESVIEKLKLDYFIDDDLPLLEFLARKKQKTTLCFVTQRVPNKKSAVKYIRSLSDFERKYIHA